MLAAHGPVGARGVGERDEGGGRAEDLLEKAGRDVKVADLDEMGRWVVECTARRQYLIVRDLESTVDLLHRRADAIGASRGTAALPRGGMLLLFYTWHAT